MTNINEWCSVSQISGESGTNQITVNIEEYKGLEDRSHTLKVVSADGMKEVFVTIQQKAFIPIFEVSETSIYMIDETTATINVTSNVDWYCNTDITWINLDIVQGFGDKTITVTAQEFTGQDRNGYIHFYVGGELKKSVKIYQMMVSDEQFYIEPYNEGEEIEIVIDSASFKTYKVGDTKWNVGSGNQISFETNKRVYIKDLISKSEEYIFKGGRFSTNYYKIGGKLSTLFGTSSKKIGLCKGSYYSDGDSGLMDASDLIVDTNTVNAFENCKSLTFSKLPQFDFTKVTSFRGMFKDCTYLTTAPDLSLATLDDIDCRNMFENCTSLVNPPKLPPATTRVYSYENMFKNCTSLVTAPELPATELGTFGYQYMFYNCTSLVNAPDLPATTVKDYHYEYMFYNCTSLVTAPAISATTLGQYCCRYMFKNCTSLVNAPELPATELGAGCYEGMFADCSSLVTAPDLPAPVIVDSCYQEMFRGCSSLNYIKMLAVNGYPSSCLYQWTDGVPENGTFVKKKGFRISYDDTYGIPLYWTVIEVD